VTEYGYIADFQYEPAASEKRSVRQPHHVIDYSSESDYGSDRPYRDDGQTYRVNRSAGS